MRTRFSYFTWIELVTAMVIIIGLALVAMRYLVLGPDCGPTKEGKSRGILKSIELIVEQYRMDEGYYPQAYEPRTLPFTELKSPEGRPYGDARLCYGSDGTVDAYGNPIWYLCQGRMNTQSFDLWSAGKDKRYGKGKSRDPLAALTDGEDCDDLTNWKRWY